MRPGGAPSTRDPRAPHQPDARPASDADGSARLPVERVRAGGDPACARGTSQKHGSRRGLLLEGEGGGQGRQALDEEPAVAELAGDGGTLFEQPLDGAMITPPQRAETQTEERSARKPPVPERPSRGERVSEQALALGHRAPHEERKAERRQRIRNAVDVSDRPEEVQRFAAGHLLRLKVALREGGGAQPPEHLGQLCGLTEPAEDRGALIEGTATFAVVPLRTRRQPKDRERGRGSPLVPHLARRHQALLGKRLRAIEITHVVREYRGDPQGPRALDPVAGSRFQGLLQPATRLGEVTADIPEPPQGAAEPQRRLRLPRVEKPTQRRAQIAHLALEPLQPHALPGSVKLWFCLLCEGEEVRGVRTAAGRLLALRRQPVGAVLLDGLQHPEAGLTGRVEPEQHALVDQGGDHLEQVAIDAPGRLHNRRRRIEGGPADEHGQETEQALLVGPEQVVAPRDGIAQRPLPVGQVAGPAGQKLKPALEAGDHRFRLKQLDAGGGELDRERQAVQTSADLPHRAGVLGAQTEIRPRRLRALHEERNRREHAQGIAVDGVAAQMGNRERHHRELVLAGEAQHRPARDQHLQRGAGLQQIADEGGRVEHVLESIQDEQRLAVLQVQHELLDRRPLAGVGDTEGPRNPRRDECGIVDPPERDETHVVGEFIPRFAGDLDREAGLPDAARSGEREEPHIRVTEQLAGPRDIVLAPEERRAFQRQRPRPRTHPRRRVLHIRQSVRLNRPGVWTDPQRDQRSVPEASSAIAVNAIWASARRAGSAKSPHAS